MKAEEQKREKYLPTLLIQQIRLQWYKDCRGGNAAAQRNQYPRAMRLPKDFFSYYPFGLPTHFASIIQRPDGFQIDRDCRRLMEWKPNGTMRLHPFELIQQDFFGSAKTYCETIRNLGVNYDVLIIRMRHVPFVDSTGLKNLRETILQLKNEGTYIVLSGVSESVKKDLLKGGIGELVGVENIYPKFDLALQAAKEKIEEK